MKQFNRNARVTVGNAGNAIAIGKPNSDTDGLRIRFECGKNQIANRLPNYATIDVYNLKKSTREFIANNFGKTVQLEVGYGEQLRTLFSGQLVHAIPVHEATEWRTRLYCMDGYRPLRESRVNLSFREGVPVRYVIEQVAEAFGSAASGFAIIGLDDLPVETLRPVQASGPTRIALDDLGTTYGFQWGFHDGRLEIYGPDASFADDAVRISAATGMINHPVVTDLGVEVSTLLNPAIRVRRRIVLESVGADVRVGQIEVRDTIPTLHTGTYVVGEVVFAGDTWGQEWVSKIKTFRPGANP